MEKGLLIILSGPSGVGKGSIRKKLMEENNLNFFYSISETTRKARNGEVDGSDYYFVSEETFKNDIAKGNLLEYNQFVGNYYGTPKDKVEEKRNQGKNVILEIDVNGAKQVSKACANDSGLVSIFIVPPSLKELENRLRGRATETEESIKRRLHQAEGEMKLAPEYDFTVINDALERVAKEIADIIKSKLAAQK